MKTKALFILASLVLSAPVFAQVANPHNSVESHMSNIVDRVRNCSILPYSLDRDGRKVYHAITSHCSEVKVLPKGKARVKVGGHTYLVQLTEALDSDGDFYHVQIKDQASGDIGYLNNIAAYGDVLLAILSGNYNGVEEVFITSPEQIATIDANLFR